MLSNQILNNRSKGFVAVLFRQRSGNIARDGIGAPRANSSLDSGKLLLR